MKRDSRLAIYFGTLCIGSDVLQKVFVSGSDQSFLDIRFKVF